MQGTSFAVERGEILGIVGESGCGKTTAGLSVMGLITHPGRVVDGRIRFRGRDLDEMDEDERRILRGEEMAMIFQDPQASLNPLMTVGDQIAEIFQAHGRIGADEVRQQTEDALASLGLADPAYVMNSYPWQMSGGMCQRVMLAMMLVLEPELLIADEPTSALDVTLQAEILERILRLAKEHGTAGHPDNARHGRDCAGGGPRDGDVWRSGYGGCRYGHVVPQSAESVYIGAAELRATAGQGHAAVTRGAGRAA